MNRPKWKTPTDDELRKMLSESDTETINERCSRSRFVWEEYGPPVNMLMIGGVPAMLSIEEMMRSYIAGNFLSVVLLAQVFVEHSLGGQFAMQGDDSTAESGLSKLIDEASVQQIISTKTAERLHELREMRNPYTHPHVGLKKRSYMARLLAKGPEPFEMAEKDARTAIQIVIDFLRDGSPNWTPDDENQDAG